MAGRRSLFAAICTALLMLGLTSGAGAQEMREKARQLGENVREACSKDMRSYCTQVSPGGGRLVACFFAHQDKISVGCEMALLEASDKIEWVVDEVRSAVATCAVDIRKHCAGMVPGEGRIFQCLRDNQGDLTRGCTQVVNRVASRLAAR